MKQGDAKLALSKCTGEAVPSPPPPSDNIAPSQISPQSYGLCSTFSLHSQQICTSIIQVPCFYSYSPEYTPVITLALCPGCIMGDTCVWSSIIKSNPSQPIFPSMESSILQVCFTLFQITWTLRNVIFSLLSRNSGCSASLSNPVCHVILYQF